MNVAVKPLIWERGDRPDEIVYTAESITGLYIIRFDGRATDETAWMLFVSGEWDCFGSLPDAQAGAQADYESRILSALSPQPPVTPEQAAGGAVAFASDYGPLPAALQGYRAEQVEVGRRLIEKLRIAGFELRRIAGDGHD